MPFLQIGLVWQKQWDWYILLVLCWVLQLTGSYNNLCYWLVQVASSHLDTVLEKLKDILDNVGHSFFLRFVLWCHDCFYIWLFMIMIRKSSFLLSIPCVSDQLLDIFEMFSVFKKVSLDEHAALSYQLNACCSRDWLWNCFYFSWIRVWRLIF